MKTKLSIIILSVFTAMLIAASGAFAHTLTVSDGAGKETETVEITINTTNPGDIAAAALTVTFDTNTFTLEDVKSLFFDTFSNQWAAVPVTGPANSVDVDGVTYDQPILFQEDVSLGTDGGVMLAGAQCQKGDTNETLFTLTFKINVGAVAGNYTLGVQPTKINNEAAGYSADGEDIPYLVGSVLSEPLASAYPALTVDNVVAGTITVTPNLTDSDEDGIDDGWEIDHFGDLTTADETTDTDHDGYSDLQEYLNEKDPEHEGRNPNDPDGVAFDPWVINVEGGTGHDRETDFWMLIDGETKPSDIMRYGNQILANYRSVDGWLYTWDVTSEWGKFGNWDMPFDKSFEVDLWHVEGEIQLAVNWISFGKIWVHSYHYGWYSPASAPERLDSFGNKIVGAGWGDTVWNYGWPTPGWVKLKDEKAIGKMVEVNYDSDAESELAACFSDGLWLYDETDGWSKIDSNCPENMIGYANGLAADFGDTGIFTYNKSNGEQAIKTDAPQNALQMAAFDMDKDGNADELVVILSDGLYVYDGSWQKINNSAPLDTLTPEAFVVYADYIGGVRFECKLAVDFGTGGLYVYDWTNGWMLMHKGNPVKMVPVDIDKDDKDEVVVLFSDSLYLLDDSIQIFNPEALVLDYFAASSELKTYDRGNTSEWNVLDTKEPIMMVTADVDSDGKKELAVVFVGGGLSIYDEATGWDYDVTTKVPEAIIPYNNGLAIDLGADGLWKYETALGVPQQMDTRNPVKMETVDFDKDGTDELAVILDDDSLWYYSTSDGWHWIWDKAPDDIKRHNNRLFINFYSNYNGSWTWDPINTFVKMFDGNTDLSTAVEVDLWDDDGELELAFNYSGWGAIWVHSFKYGWYKITGGNGDRIDRYGKTLVLDWGQDDTVWQYSQAYKWVKIGTGAADGKMVEADIDKDGKKELAVGFLNADGSDDGLYIYDDDTGSWTKIYDTLPDEMIASDVFPF